MGNAVVHDTDYTLAEKAILSRPWLSPSTLTDVLARPVITIGADEPPATRLRKVAIKKQGPEVSVEIYGSGPLARGFLESVRGIAELLSLPSGWNSYSAKPIAPENAVRAIQLIAELLDDIVPAPLIVPRVRGGIQLEWHTKRTDIEISIDSPERVTFCAEHLESGESTEGPLSGREHELKAWVQRLS